jgi:hypothetical protein
VGDHQQLVVDGQRVHRCRVGVPVDHPRCPAGRGEPQLAAVVGGPADGGQRAADLQARRIGRPDLGNGDGVRATGERLGHPDAELIAVGVGEPPDGLAVGAERADQRAVGPIGRLTVLVGLAVPGVLLDHAAEVGGVEVPVRRVLRPVGQRHARSTEAGLPAGGDLGGEGGGVRDGGLDCHAAILPGARERLRGRRWRPLSWWSG